MAINDEGQIELTKYDDGHIDGAKYAQLISLLEEPVLTLSREIKKNSSEMACGGGRPR